MEETITIKEETVEVKKTRGRPKNLKFPNGYKKKVKPVEETNVVEVKKMEE